MTPPFSNPSVERAFAGFPEEPRRHLLTLREMIFETAGRTPGVGPIAEMLKWGQPAYLTPETKSGSTLRLGITKTGEAALFVHCQTTIISDFKAQFPTEFQYDGNRAVILPTDARIEGAPLGLLITSALIYHYRKRSGTAA